MSRIKFVVGGVGILTLLLVIIFLTSSGLSKDVALEDEFEARFGRSLDETVSIASAQAFESSWNQTFGDTLDQKKKASFQETFRTTFSETFKRTLGVTPDRADSQIGQTTNGQPWKQEETFREGDTIGWRDQLTFDESAIGLEQLDLKTVNGNIKLTGSDTNRVHIVVRRTVKSTSEAGGHEYRRAFRPIVRREGKRLVVETRYPEGERSRPRYVKEASMTYEVSLPSSFRVRAESVNGSVDVQDIETEATLHTVNGTIKLTSAEGLQAGIQAQSVNGKIHVQTRRLGQKSRMETVNGSIELSIDQHFSGGLSAQTVNGSMNLRLPNDASFSLRGQVGGGGSIQTDWGSPAKRRGGVGSSYEVAVNGGGNRVDLQTVNGSIRVGAYH